MSTPQLHPDAAAVEFLPLAGHPLRRRILGELARSDRIVHELTGSIGEPRRTAAELVTRIGFLLAVISDRTPAPKEKP